MNVREGRPASPLTVLGADAGGLAPLRLPDPDRVFQVRAERLAALAAGHAAAPFLALLAAVARGQHRAVREIRIVAPGGPLDDAPLDHGRWERGPGWRAMLRVVLAATGGGLPPPAREAIVALEGADAAALEALADDVLGGAPRDLARAPFVGAALQAYFTRLAGGLGALAGGRRAPGPGCPVCASPPVAGVVLGTERVRYVACSLCAVQWHVPRVQCVTCRSGGALSYFAVEGAAAGAHVEACDGCGTYLKLFDLQEAPAAEPVADDAATLVLDLLVGDRGYRRAGVNPLAPAGVRAPAPVSTSW